MQNWNGSRLTAIAGVLFIVGSLVSAFMVSPPPSPDEPASKFLAYFSDNRSTLLAQGIIGVLTLVPGMLFAGGLADAFRRSAKGPDVLGSAAVYALIAGLAAITVVTCLTTAVAFLANGAGLQEQQAKDLGLMSGTFNLGIFALLGALSCFSGARFLTGSIVPRWVAWLGLVVGALSFLATGSVAKTGAFAPFGFISFLGFLSFSVYVVVISVFLWLRSESEAAAPAPVSSAQPA